MTAIAAVLPSSAGAVSLKRVPSAAATFESPTFVAQPPRDSRRLFVVEQGGAVRVIKDGALLEKEFIDLAAGGFDLVGITGNSEGLFSIAFPPHYGNGRGATTRRFYASFTNKAGEIEIAEFKRSTSSGSRASPAYHRTVLTVPHPLTDHNAGQLQFGPDGFLYASTGDGGSFNGPDPENYDQNKEVLLGKLLRIDPRPSGSRSYSIPPGNPFAGPTEGADEIYALGFRNPWRFSFDGGTLFIPDVGQDEFEEVNFMGRRAAKGANFGWSGYEGPKVFNPERAGAIPVHAAPRFWYCHDGVEDELCPAAPVGCSVTGGYVARDDRLPKLLGRYLYADFCTGVLRRFDPADPAGTDQLLGVHVGHPVSFGIDNADRIYIVSRAGGIYKLVPGP